MRPLIWLFLVALALGCCGGAESEATGDEAGLVVWRYPGGDAKPPVLAFSVPAKPAKGTAITDPVYGTPITRVTDRTVDGYTAAGITNEYARVDPENAGGSRALLRDVDGNWCLYRIPGFEMARTLTFRGNPDPEPRWDPADPDVVYFVEGPSLWQYNVATEQETLIHDFSAEEPGCAFARSRFEGEPSLDTRYWCLMLADGNYDPLSVVCYDAQADHVIGRMASFAGEIDWVGMSPGGTRCIVGYDYPARAASYARDFADRVDLPVGIGHADVARTASGTDVLVYQNASTDWIAMADLETGEETNLLPIPFSDNADIGLHISGNCDSRPGWVLISTYGQTADAQSWMDRCLFMVQLAQRPVVWRVAQTFQLQAADTDYFGEAFAAINRAGTRVWWGANWDNTGAGNLAYDVYVADLPAAWDSSVLALTQ